MNSREQFELAYCAQFGCVKRVIEDLRRGGEYSNKDGVGDRLESAWWAWQASRSCATPEWEHSPDWANWLAMDPDGRWYWHAAEPEQGVVRWRNPWGSRVTEAGWTLGRSGWTETLEPRP